MVNPYALHGTGRHNDPYVYDSIEAFNKGAAWADETWTNRPSSGWHDLTPDARAALIVRNGNWTQAEADQRKADNLWPWSNR